MGLLRTILTLIILVIMAHIALVFFGYEPETNQVVAAIYGLGSLFVAPAQLVLPDQGFFITALAAIGGYLLLQILLGLLER
jgi:hypothetical protein